MKTTLSALALVATVLSSPAVHAITVSSVNSNGNVVDTTLSTSSLVSLDVSFFNAGPVGFTFTVDSDDVKRGGFEMDGILREVSGGTFSNVLFDMSKPAYFSECCNATSINNEALITYQHGGGQVDLIATSPTNEIYFGDPFDEGPYWWQKPWFIGLDGSRVKVGDVITMTLSLSPVPEPGSSALALAGLGALAWVARRRSA